MKVLIAAAGSHGDVLPFLAVAREFQRRGHSVRLYTHAYFESLVRRVGVECVAIGSAEEYVARLRNPDLNHPARALGVLAQYFDIYARPSYDAAIADVERGNTILIGSSLAFGMRFIAETHHVPVATVHLSPSLIRSVHRMPRFGPASRTSTPKAIKRLIYWLIDTIAADPTLGAALNRHRAKLGLRPIRRFFHEWLHQADIVVGMFPDWFGERQPDWPSNLVLTGFPLYDQGSDRSLPAEVEAFLAKGASPVGFTAGTANAAAREFFVQSVEACRRSGRRALLLTEHADQVPDQLPESVMRSSYVPFSKLLPRLSAFVHHGGIGTTSQAMRAGVPQLIRPVTHDQYDNSDHAGRLGVALEILPKAYRADKIVATLNRLETDVTIRAAC